MGFILDVISAIWFGFITWFILVPITLGLISGTVALIVVILRLLYERFNKPIKRRF